MKATTAVDLNGLAFQSPVLVASGCFGTGKEVSGIVDPGKLGGVVTRTITALPRRGAPGPRVGETISGMLYCVGWQNPGVEAFLDEELPRLARPGLPIVVSVGGASLEEFVRVTGAVGRAPGVAALEVALGGPDEELGLEAFAARPERAAEVAGAVARLAPLPVFAKLPALVADLAETARACVRAGVHGLTLVDAVPAMAVDIDAMRPLLGGATGYLSGPAIRPIAVRAVYEVARVLPGVPIIGVGGVVTGRDAAEMMLAGAWAVQVGTAALVDPAAPVDIAQGLLAFLREKGLASPADLRGLLRTARGGGVG
ncbi:MAG TPA: dihydroorotate dehydrogenase [Actinomycetota bacterium]|nr:dihydroorotate dehydrogenase [Actinomycetota bacterium]